jgi:hypothetical protein
MSEQETPLEIHQLTLLGHRFFTDVATGVTTATREDMDKLYTALRPLIPKWTEALNDTRRPIAWISYVNGVMTVVEKMFGPISPKDVETILSDTVKAELVSVIKGSLGWMITPQLLYGLANKINRVFSDSDIPVCVRLTVDALDPNLVHCAYLHSDQNTYDV